MNHDHFDLLRREHLELQTKYAELKKKYDVLSAQTSEEDSFAAALLHTTASLLNTTLYSDVTLEVGDLRIPCHRIVIASRTSFWDLKNSTAIRLEDEFAPAANLLVHWIYTDVIDKEVDVDSLILLSKIAFKYQIRGLISTCETLLSNRVEVDNVVSVYEFADERELKSLREKCSTIISTRWKDLVPSHFAKLSAPLLLKMLKAQSSNALHAIVELAREDVLFLYFIENDSTLFEVVNAVGEGGKTALELALRRGVDGIAEQLIQHKADVNLRDKEGRPILHRLIDDDIVADCAFLASQGADLTLTDTNGYSIVHLLARNANISTEMIEWFERVAAKVKLDSFDNSGSTPLHHAVLSSNLRMISLLLTLCSSCVDLKTGDGESSLSLALFKQNSLPIARKLIEAGADVNQKYREGYLVHRARDNKDILAFLLESGANPNVEDAEGFSPLRKCLQDGTTDSIPLLMRAGSLSSGYLRYALDHDNIPAAKCLIEEGCDLDEKDEVGVTPLVATLRNKLDPVAVFLLEKNASHRFGDPSTGASCLELAVSGGLASALRLLCSRGVDINERLDGGFGFPVIVRALQNDQLDCASVLISFGCDVEGLSVVGGVSVTLLHHCLDMGWQKAAILLIESGCDVNALRGFSNVSDDDRLSPLHMAVLWQQDDVLPYLVHFGADLCAQDVDGRTPCHVAVREDNEKAVEVLLTSENVDFLSMRDKHGLTPLSLALSAKKYKMAEKMVQRLPFILVQCNGNGENMLHTAARNNCLESVLFMLGTQMGPGRPMSDGSERTALHLAAYHSDNEMILRNLLLAGSNIDARSSDGSTPLHFAAAAQRFENISVLIDNKANPNIVDLKGQNPLHIAVQTGSVDCVRVLVQDSAVDLKAVNSKGQTALHVCATTTSPNSVQIGEIILSALPEGEVPTYIDSRDLNGNTPLLLAYMAGSGSVCRLLLRKGASMGVRNAEGTSLFNYDTPTKQLLFGLLETLEREPRWSEGDSCGDCDAKFSLTTRKHHCRHCGRVLCAKCSETTLPIIKWGGEKRVRVCTFCAQLLTIGSGLGHQGGV